MTANSEYNGEPCWTDPTLLGLNEYVISHYEEYIIYTKVWAKNEDDAHEVLWGSIPGWTEENPEGYEVPEPVELRRSPWGGSDITNVVRVNGVYKNGYEYMEENGYLK